MQLLLIHLSPLLILLALGDKRLLIMATVSACTCAVTATDRRTQAVHMLLYSYCLCCSSPYLYIRDMYQSSVYIRKSTYNISYIVDGYIIHSSNVMRVENRIDFNIMTTTLHLSFFVFMSSFTIDLIVSALLLAQLFTRSPF